MARRTWRWCPGAQRRHAVGTALQQLAAAALASRIGGMAVPDAQSGFRALSRGVAQAGAAHGAGYDFETALLLAALARAFR